MPYRALRCDRLPTTRPALHELEVDPVAMAAHVVAQHLHALAGPDVHAVARHRLGALVPADHVVTHEAVVHLGEVDREERFLEAVALHAASPRVVHEDPGPFLRLARPRVANRQAAHGNVVRGDLEDGVRAAAVDDGPRFTLQRDPRAIDDDARLSIRPAPDEDARAGCGIAHGVAYLAHGARHRHLDRQAGCRTRGRSFLSPRVEGDGGRHDEHVAGPYFCTCCRRAQALEAGARSYERAGARSEEGAHGAQSSSGAIAQWWCDVDSGLSGAACGGVGDDARTCCHDLTSPPCLATRSAGDAFGANDVICRPIGLCSVPPVR
jgi:hypothetical protein